ncbi:MAG: hypothetical protein IJP39_08065 [Bacteroidales bacterium]|nr:hypothetical protein [Bacteroidales bacterium]
MNLKRFIASVFALTAVLSACEQQEELGTARITVNPTELSFDQAEGSKTVELTATRDWDIASQPDWLALSVSSGPASTKPQTVSVTVDANPGFDREGDVVFSIDLRKVALKVVQKGSAGELKKGTGTLEDPYTVTGAIEYVKSLGSDVNSPSQVYVKGIISDIPKTDETYATSGTYGNATFYISDDGNAENQFYCYRILYLGNKKYTSAAGADIKKGDEVIIHGKVVNYKGNTPETVQNEAYLYSLNGKVGEKTPDQTEITSCSVAEFISKADPNTYYRLTGKVSSFKTGTNKSGKNYMQFDLTDDTASIVVYGFKDGEYDKWATKIKDGGTAVITGTYEFYSAKSQHEVMNTTVESFTEGAPVQGVTGTVAQTIAAAEGAKVTINEAFVAGKSNYGFIVADESGAVYIYYKKGETIPSANIGDKVKVEATKSVYGGIPEFTEPTLTVISSGSGYTYPAPKDITAGAASYQSSVSEYIQLSGTLSISGNYVNIAIPGVDSSAIQGSLSAPLESLGVSSFDGKDVIVKGYFVGTSGSTTKYINILATEIGAGDPNAKHCSVDPKSISVKADATEASFDIKANAAWTAVSDNDAFKVEPASGEGDATVTVKFSANEGDAARVANIKVSCPDASFEATVVVTQAKPSSGEAVVISLDFHDQIEGFPQSKNDGAKDGTHTLGGYPFIFHAADAYYQAKSNDQLYILIGKKDSYIQLPAIEGKSLTKVKFLTGASASVSVIVDMAKTDASRLNVNNSALNKGTEYEWEVPGEPGVAYRIMVCSAHNAQFQNLTLTYE